jgi:TonB family protein
MKRYIWALTISLLFNLILIGLISIRWGAETRRTPSVELVFDNSPGSLFHDEIVEEGLGTGGGGASDEDGNGGSSGSKRQMGVNDQEFVRRGHSAAEERGGILGKPNHSNKLKPTELPADNPETTTDASKSTVNSDEKRGQPSMAVPRGDGESAKVGPDKTGSFPSASDASSNHGDANPAPNNSGTGNGSVPTGGNSGGENSEGHAKPGRSSKGSGTGNGVGEGDGEGPGSPGSPGKNQLNPAVPVKDVDPNYPKEAREKGWEGRAYLKLSIDPKGRVVEVELLESSGYNVLDKEAVKAAWRLRYKPATKNGVPIAWHIKRAFIFKLQ